jgi:hypothetical protein
MCLIIVLAAITDRLSLYLLCARTALINEAFGQADAFMDEAIKLMAILPAQRDVCYFLSLIIIND